MNIEENSKVIKDKISMKVNLHWNEMLNITRLWHVDFWQPIYNKNSKKKEEESVGFPKTFYLSISKKTNN